MLIRKNMMVERDIMIQRVITVQIKPKVSSKIQAHLLRDTMVTRDANGKKQGICSFSKKEMIKKYLLTQPMIKTQDVNLITPNFPKTVLQDISKKLKNLDMEKSKNSTTLTNNFDMMTNHQKKGMR
ncbi:hypothetical protein V6N13_124538 [Hibiscus sabdariffa]